MFNFRKDISKIPGWLTQNEGTFLYKQAKKSSKKYAIVEIGSWKGKSTVCLGIGVKDGEGGKVYAIDPHKDTTEHKKWSGNSDEYDTYNIFLSNIKNAGIENSIIPIRKTSEKAAITFKRPVDFLFIDGSHHFSHVKLDYELWFPKLIQNGTVAFHDAWHSLGVMAITTLMLLISTKIKNPRLIDTLIVFQKVSKNSSIDRLVNFSFIFYRLFFGWIGSMRMHVLSGTSETSTLDKRSILWLKHIYRNLFIEK
ncbi:MAG: class I SAM-dependent methyltransferase [Patescibacteria group bacterium]